MCRDGSAIRAPRNSRTADVLTLLSMYVEAAVDSFGRDPLQSEQDGCNIFLLVTKNRYSQDMSERLQELTEARRKGT